MKEFSKKKKTIVVYGGSFNPILYSHLSIAKQVIKKFKQVKKVIFVPVGNKYEKADLLADKYRYKMIKLAISRNVHFSVSDIEIKNEKQLYTFQTLMKIQEQYKNYEIWFMMGSDNLKSLHTWVLSEELLKNFKIVAVKRDTDNLEKIIKEDNFLKKYEYNIQKIDCDIVNNMSSTYVRQKIKNGESIKGLLPRKVEKYIKKNNLYLE